MKKLITLVFLFLFIQLLKAQQTTSQQTTPFVLGTVHKIESKVLSEQRVLNIYLPEGYNENDTIKYPVIYLLDGSADEDFIHITGLVQFLSFSWVDILPKSIVVGVANVDRRRDFTFPTTIAKDKKDFPTTGKSSVFIDFIEKELQPHVDKNFRTNGSKTIVGQSLGGLLATQILFEKPQLFTKYVIVSPSLWWDNESLLQKVPAFTNLKQPLSVFVAAGKEGKIMTADVNKLLAILTANKNMKVGYHYFGNESHASILHLAAYKAFESFKKKKIEF